MSFLGAQNSIALGVQGLIHIDTGGGAGGSADYLLAKSLRFRSSASAYLSRTPATATNQTTWTWSGWIKRGTLGSALQQIFGVANGSNDANYLTLFFQSDTLGFTQWNSPTLYRITTQVFRDPAAWYHIVLAVDTTQATAANRILIYVNGTAITSFSSNLNPAQNATLPINGAVVHQMGRDAFTGGSINFDGELAEVNFVDGQALAATSFGAFSTYNQWLPKKYAGTYGTNGFYLPFTNTTSTSTLVADSSGNANNWTPNNISLTAGSTYDSLTDVPTLTSATVANYAVLNPLTLSYGTLSEANLKYVGNGVNHDMIVATLAQSTGKWYFETTLTSNISMSGVVNLNSYTPRTSPTYPGGNAASWGYYPDPASPGIYNNAAITNVVASAANGDIVGIALDCDAGTISWYKNNSLLITKTIGAGNWGFVVGHLNANCVVTYGQRPFTYTPPTGFLPLNTFNI